MAGYPQAHLDRAAQQMGFRDYATYSAYQQHQAMMRQGNPPTDISGEQQQGNNWLQNLLARIPIHPAYLLGKVNDAFTQAGQ